MNHEWSVWVSRLKDGRKFCQLDARFDGKDYGIRFYSEDAEAVARDFIASAPTPTRQPEKLADFFWPQGERIRGA